MKIRIVEGAYLDAVSFSQIKGKKNIVFELTFMDSDNSAVFEFNRFLEFLQDNTEIGCPINVILELSQWNEKYLYNKYLEAFLYLLKDRVESCTFIFDKKVNKGLLDEISRLKLFEFSITELKSINKEKEYNGQIGFKVSDSKERGMRDV